MESWQIIIQNLLSLSESTFPRNKGSEKEQRSLRLSAVAMCGNVCVEACAFLMFPQ